MPTSSEVSRPVSECSDSQVSQEDYENLTTYYEIFDSSSQSPDVIPEYITLNSTSPMLFNSQIEQESLAKHL